MLPKNVHTWIICCPTDTGDINNTDHSGKATKARLNETAQLNDLSFDGAGEMTNRFDVRRSASITQPTHTIKESMSTQTDAKSPLKIMKPTQKVAQQQQQQLQQQQHNEDDNALKREGSFVRTQQIQREDSFVRTGSGRKLPKIPNGNAAAATRAGVEEENEGGKVNGDLTAKPDLRKSKPKALEFWESMENVQLIDGSGAISSNMSGPNFRYNTIHR